MANSFFQFKQFRIDQDRSAMKVTTDSCLFGAWVAEQLQRDPSTPKQILDIGAGTGLLSLMIAQKFPAVDIAAIEIDQPAAEQASENILRCPWAAMVRVFNTNIKKIEGVRWFDCIVSNPPFYEQDLTSPDDQKNQAHHDATLPFRELIVQIDRLLSDNGKFYLLLPAKGIEARIDALQSHGLFIQSRSSVHHDSEHPMMRTLLEGKRSRTEQITTEQINIHEKNGDYSERFRGLLKDYYLAF
jgi:tRNA1Val (adenine37-N6)-methyltransferase